MCNCLTAHMAPCRAHGDDPWTCPDQLFAFSPEHGYGIPIRDGGGSQVGIIFCPFCGERLPVPGAEEDDREGAESPYCPGCGACGEAGCCPPTQCKTVQCHYGESYLKDYAETVAEIDTLTAERDAILRLAVMDAWYVQAGTWAARGPQGRVFGATAEEAVRRAAGLDQHKSNADS